jgi:eukaryotic-like serine/threonine-protein kinase
MNAAKDDRDLPPVMVIENIPAAGTNQIPEGVIKAEGIPTPDHLVLYPELGRGGMGRIHPATDRSLLRHVALKRLDAGLSKVRMYRDGFIAEAQITGQLEHPNVVPVHELAVSELGVPYFTMKLVQGVALDKWLWNEALPLGSTERLQEGLEIFLKVCDAMAYAHHRGVIHRDLKPENIMVADFGQVYLMDWGLARLTKSRPSSGPKSQMEAEGPVGTPSYMAPEQARGIPGEMDERTDVFGLGAILYEILTNRVPYGSESNPDVIIGRAKAGKTIPIELVAHKLQLNKLGVSPRIFRIVDKCLATHPDDRFQSVLELQQEVRAFLRGGLYLPRRSFRPGEIIIREGDVGDAAYLIVAGECKATRKRDEGEEELVVMGPGDVFGEMALVLDAPRAATVEAIDDVAVLVLDKKTLTEGLGLDSWGGALVHALAKRFQALEQQVRESGIKRGPNSAPGA